MADFVPAIQVRARCATPPAPRRDDDALARVRNAIRKRMGQAIGDFAMIAPGDRIMVCLSGGKDSYALLDMLEELRPRAPVAFTLVAVNVDQGWPGYRTDLIAEFLARAGVEHRMVSHDFATIVDEKIEPGKTPCSLCSRLRRGVLYNLAVELGCTKIALGHHMDDLIETLFLNLFYAGKLASMPAVLHARDGRNTVIRPLAYVPEALLEEYAALRGFPLVSCGCPACGRPEQKRQVVKQWLGELERGEPGLKQNLLAALKNLVPGHLLDRRFQASPEELP